MKTSLEIINKLSEKEAVKLESQLVELNKIEDLYKSITTTLFTNIEKYENSINEIVKEKNNLKKVFDKINNEQKKVSAEYDVKARELGLALNDIPNFKKMYDSLLFAEDQYYKLIEKQI
jgi:hypothetical protein